MVWAIAQMHKIYVQITVKAGTCKQQFAALNADCATLKQGLANLGLKSQTVEPIDTSVSKEGQLLRLRCHQRMTAALISHKILG